MREPVLMPEVGAGAVVSLWFVRLGEKVHAGDRLVEILVGDATVDVTAPIGGRLVEVRAFPERKVAAGEVLGFIGVAD